MPLTPEEFEAKYPILIGWIRQTVAAHAERAMPVDGFGFQRLPAYFSPALLALARVVPVETLPMPPLSQMGLTQFTEWERIEYGGITYLDTYFVTQNELTNEALHFHELVHVLQWRLLGPERFVALYSEGLEKFGYRSSPLEVTAYDLEERFRSSPAVFDAEAEVRQRLKGPRRVRENPAASRVEPRAGSACVRDQPIVRDHDGPSES